MSREGCNTRDDTRKECSNGKTSRGVLQERTENESQLVAEDIQQKKKLYKPHKE